MKVSYDYNRDFKVVPSIGETIRKFYPWSVVVVDANGADINCYGYYKTFEQAEQRANQLYEDRGNIYSREELERIASDRQKEQEK